VKHSIVFLLATALVALMALLPASVQGQEKIIAGLKPGYSTLSVTTEKGLERTVVGHSPATEAIRLTGLTDKLGWPELPATQWDAADTALAQRRVNATAAWYQSRGWTVDLAGIETQTPYRGVRIEIVEREYSLSPAPAAQRTEAAANRVEQILAELNASKNKNSAPASPSPILTHPRVKFTAYHFQSSSQYVGGRRVFDEGAFFTLSAQDWLRASSGTEPGQFTRVTLSPLPTIWKHKLFQLKAGLNASLLSHDAHFDTQTPNYTLGKIKGCLGATVLIDSLFGRGQVRLDWLGVGNNVRPQDETVYYSWLGGLRNTKLYPFETRWSLGRDFYINFAGLLEKEKQWAVPYFFGTIEKQLISFPSPFSSATRLSVYCGYGEEQMLPGAHCSRGTMLGLGIGF